MTGNTIDDSVDKINRENEINRESFEENISRYINPESNFYERIITMYDIGQHLVGKGHGLTIVMKRDGDTPELNRHTRNSYPINGKKRTLYDKKIVDLLDDKRTRDLSFVVDQYGEFTHSNVPLPMEIPNYQEKYGIQISIGEFLGYTGEGEDFPGARGLSSLYASDVCVETIKVDDQEYVTGEAIIIAFGESGTTRVYWCGDIIHDSTGKEVKWGEQRPQIYSRCGE